MNGDTVAALHEEMRDRLVTAPPKQLTPEKEQ